MISPATFDDIFLCELFLYDFEAWLDNFHDNYTWANDRNFQQELEAAKDAQIEVIRRFEALGMRIEPPDFWETEGRLARLIDNGEWTRWGPN